QEAKPAPPEAEVPHYTPKSRHPDSLPRERVERVKSLNPIVQVIGQYVQLRPSGSNLVGLCPFHEDRIPSFTVYPSTGTFHCYGCGKHGDVISFVGWIEHLNFGQVLDA